MVLVTTAAAAYGCDPIMVKIALRSHTGTATLLSIRYVIAAVCLLVLMAARRQPFPRGRSLATLIALGVFGNVAHSGLYFLALSHAPAASVAILLFIYPALVTIIAAFWLRERVPLVKWAAVMMALSGAMLTVGHAPRATLLGSAYALGSAAWYAGYIVVSSRLTAKFSTLAATTVVVTSSAVVFSTITLLTTVQFPDSSAGWAAATGIALIGTVLAILAFFGGLSRVGPVTTSAMGTLEPIVTVILATLILAERFSAIQFIGGAMVLGAVFLLSQADGRAGNLPAVDK
jgi:drug/metabolite transporter (DMT)-like permease